ncbi:MAG: hypothetical protein C6I05_00445, partial [Epsilonproteobacteria bacterium]|nr:hypothetical protein [Campylobacterota bacterium]
MTTIFNLLLDFRGLGREANRQGESVRGGRGDSFESLLLRYGSHGEEDAQGRVSRGRSPRAQERGGEGRALQEERGGVKGERAPSRELPPLSNTKGRKPLPTAGSLSERFSREIGERAIQGRKRGFEGADLPRSTPPHPEPLQRESVGERGGDFLPSQREIQREPPPSEGEGLFSSPERGEMGEIVEGGDGGGRAPRGDRVPLPSPPLHGEEFPSPPSLSLSENPSQGEGERGPFPLKVSLQLPSPLERGEDHPSLKGERKNRIQGEIGKGSSPLHHSRPKRGGGAPEEVRGGAVSPERAVGMGSPAPSTSTPSSPAPSAPPDP